jgi:hypothetical protein
MDTFAAFVSLANSHGIYVAPTLETPEGCPANAFFQRRFPSRSYPIPNTQYLDADGQAAKAWYAAAFMNETVARLGSSSGIFALLLENEAYYQNDVIPFSSTAPAPQWQTAAGVLVQRRRLPRICCQCDGRSQVRYVPASLQAAVC